MLLITLMANEEMVDAIEVDADIDEDIADMVIKLAERNKIYKGMSIIIDED